MTNVTGVSLLEWGGKPVYISYNATSASYSLFFNGNQVQYEDRIGVFEVKNTAASDPTNGVLSVRALPIEETHHGNLEVYFDNKQRRVFARFSGKAVRMICLNGYISLHPIFLQYHNALAPQTLRQVSIIRTSVQI